jgi:hypothetical protein
LLWIRRLLRLVGVVDLEDEEGEEGEEEEGLREALDLVKVDRPLGKVRLRGAESKGIERTIYD